MAEKGSERIDEELDIIKIAKRLRNLKILVEHESMRDKKLKWLIKNTGKNIIDLDENDGLDSSSSS